MRIPKCDEADVPRQKITDYLLNLEHPDGAPKAAIFLSFGFSIDRPEELIDALKSHAAENDYSATVEGRFGTKFIVEAPLRCPQDRPLMVRSVWIITEKQPNPRLVTAYGMD